MRKVMSNEMVAHVFAQQKQESARSHNGNFSFEKTRLYSYSTVIAEFRVAVDGSRVLNRTSETFSITTSGKHENALAHAIDGVRVFRVPGLSRYDSERDLAALDELNLDFLLKRAADCLAYGKRGRIANTYRAEPVTLEDAGRYGDGPRDIVADLIAAANWQQGPIPRFVADAIAAYQEARDYAVKFGLSIGVQPIVEVQAAIEEWNERVAAYHTPQAINRRVKEAERRERKEADAIEAKRKAAESYNLERFNAWKRNPNLSRPASEAFAAGSVERAELEAVERAAEEQRQRGLTEAFNLWKAGAAPRPDAWRYDGEMRAELQAAEKAAALADWRSGSREPFYGYDESGIGAALRLRGETVETSRGATVPLEHALKAFAFMRLIWQQGRTWHKNGHSLRVGHFTVDSIDAEQVKAGCHILRRVEVERFAASIGADETQPNDSALIASDHA